VLLVIEKVGFQLEVHEALLPALSGRGSKMVISYHKHRGEILLLIMSICVYLWILLIQFVDLMMIFVGFPLVVARQSLCLISTSKP
jgi:hypothetical protein